MGKKGKANPSAEGGVLRPLQNRNLNYRATVEANFVRISVALSSVVRYNRVYPTRAGHLVMWQLPPTASQRGN